MTPRQHQALTFIRAYIAKHGYSPSNQEIAASLSLKSQSSVMPIVDRLLDSGALARVPGGSRGLVVPVSEYERGFQDGLWAARAKHLPSSACA